MTEMFPLLPLNEGQALSIALTSYDGGVFFGVNADRDAVPDVNAVGCALTSALQELVELSNPGDAATVLVARGSSSVARTRPTSTRARRPRRSGEETTQ